MTLYDIFPLQLPFFPLGKLLSRSLVLEAIMVNFFRKPTSKGRKYPIKYDERGQTARSRAFAAFDRGLRPAQVIREVNISLRTARRYFADWKKLPPRLEDRYRLLEYMIRRDSGLPEQISQVAADLLGVSQEEILACLQTPWGRKRILAGRWPASKGSKPAAERQSREAAANELVYLLGLAALHQRIGALFDRLEEGDAGDPEAILPPAPIATRKAMPGFDTASKALARAQGPTCGRALKALKACGS